jgi:hypothetical protein
MKDFLQDLISHVHTLGVLPVVKVDATGDTVTLTSVSDDKNLIFNAKTHTNINGLQGIFGLSNFHTLDLHLKCPEYRENSKISLMMDNRNNQYIPVGIHFENEHGDYKNYFKFIPSVIIDQKVKAVEINIPSWDVEFQPTINNIQRFKLQSSVHTDEKLFHLLTKDNNLIVKFGDDVYDSGEFVLQPNISCNINPDWLWSKSAVLSALSLDGDKFVKITNKGALQITVDSGIAEYNYIFRPVVK